MSKANPYLVGRGQGTIHGALARAKQVESNALTTHMEAVEARTAGRPAMDQVDYSAHEAALEALLDIVEGCGGKPSRAAQEARANGAVSSFLMWKFPGRRISGSLVTEALLTVEALAYQHDREHLMVVAAQRKALLEVAHADAELLLRDVRTRNALTLSRLLKSIVNEVGTGGDGVIEAALARALNGEVDEDSESVGEKRDGDGEAAAVVADEQPWGELPTDDGDGT